MIGFHNRFHGHNSLSTLFRKGRVVRGKDLSLKYLQTDRPTSRVAVVISKKVAKSAVVRNRIRRRVYEILRLKFPEFKGSYDISVGIFSSELAKVPAAELEKQVSDLLKSAQIIEGSGENSKK